MNTEQFRMGIHQSQRFLLCPGYAVSVDVSMWTNINFGNIGIEHTLSVYILIM